MSRTEDILTIVFFLIAATLRGVIAQQLLPKVGGGRIAAREIMINTPAIANLIRENKTYGIMNVIHTGSKDGMITLEKTLVNLKAKIVAKPPVIKEAAIRTINSVLLKEVKI